MDLHAGDQCESTNAVKGIAKELKTALMYGTPLPDVTEVKGAENLSIDTQNILNQIAAEGQVGVNGLLPATKKNVKVATSISHNFTQLRTVLRERCTLKFHKHRNSLCGLR